MNFKIGQKVVCVDADLSQPLIKGHAYIVDSTSFCKCGQQRITVGILSVAFISRCVRCNTVERAAAYWDFSSFRFRPLEYNSAHDEIIEKYPLTEEVPDTPIKEPQS